MNLINNNILNKLGPFSRLKATVCVCVCGRADLLPDEHAGDEESVQTQHAVQDVAQPRVVHHHHSLCGGFS